MKSTGKRFSEAVASVVNPLADPVRWEYLSKDNCTDNELNVLLGAVGWELVTVTLSEYNARRFYFKRRV